MFAVSGLDQVIPNFADLDEALAPDHRPPPPARGDRDGAQAGDTPRADPAAARPQHARTRRRLNGHPAPVPGSCCGWYQTDRQPGDRLARKVGGSPRHDGASVCGLPGRA
jgi:hypothetical protein